jgi:2-polyprenyl-6-methoxyphenol 4-hydroxylase
MSMARPDYQIVIAGGGMVGISLALALEKKAPDSRILLVESFELPTANNAAAYTPSFDARSTALSYASCLIYRELGLWGDLEAQLQNIETIHVSDQGRFGSTLLKAGDYGWSALGFVAENAWLGQVLAGALKRSAAEIRSPASVIDVHFGADRVALDLDNGDALTCELLVIADGARSRLRDRLGIVARQRTYDQSAIIANVGHGQPHGGRAFERFTPRGPLALLPLVRPDSGVHRSALVWTLPPRDAADLMEAGDADFLARLQGEFGYRLGRLQQVGVRQSYPLALVETEEQVRSNVVVMGNAAHSLHPVAGQGFNLALRDVARFSGILGDALGSGVSPGDLEVLERYRSAQSGDQRLTTAFSDRLPGLFMSEDRSLGLIRDFGLFALDLSPGLKREFVRQTAGLTPSAGYRDVQP